MDDVKRLELGNIYSTSWKIYTNKFKEILMVVLIVYIPINTILYLISKYEQASQNSIFSKIRINQIFELLLGVLSTLAIIYITEKAKNSENIGFNSALKMAVKRWGAVILTSILSTVIIGSLLFLIVIPGIIWAVYYSFMYQVVALNGLKYKSALDYSKTLVRGNWWVVLGYSIAITLVPAILAFLIQFGLNYITDLFYGIETLEVLANTVTDIILAFSTVGMTVFFMDLEEIKAQNLNETTFYEKLNEIVNKGSEIDDSDIDEEMLSECDEGKVICPDCGAGISPDETICPVCQSILNDENRLRNKNNEGDEYGQSD